MVGDDDPSVSFADNRLGRVETLRKIEQIQFPENSYVSVKSDIVAAAQWLADQLHSPIVDAAIAVELFSLTETDGQKAVLLARRYRVCRRTPA